MFYVAIAVCHRPISKKDDDDDDDDEFWHAESPTTTVRVFLYVIRMAFSQSSYCRRLLCAKKMFRCFVVTEACSQLFCKFLSIAKPNNILICESSDDKDSLSSEYWVHLQSCRIASHWRNMTIERGSWRMQFSDSARSNLDVKKLHFRCHRPESLTGRHVQFREGAVSCASDHSHEAARQHHYRRPLVKYTK